MKQVVIRSAAWLGAALISIIVFGTIYAVAQQAERADANWPQIQLAEDAATALNRGVAPVAAAPGNVDLNTSLAPFVAIYDTAGHIVFSSGAFGKQPPEPPVGILRASRGRAYHSVTWQPKAGVRLAAVTVSADKYYVLSARSLKEVERGENRTFWLAALGALVSLAVLGAVYASKPYLTN